jgi:hypothetical protein
MCNDKKCTRCNQTKPLSDFYKKAQSKDGYDFWCKACWRTTEESRSPAVTKKRAMRSQYFTTSNLNTLIGNCRKRASIKSRVCSLTAGNVAPLLHEFCSNNYHVWEPYHPFRPSIDRLDNTGGYTLDNIRIIWSIENHCKNIYTDADVIKFCKLKLGVV